MCVCICVFHLLNNLNYTDCVILCDFFLRENSVREKKYHYYVYTCIYSHNYLYFHTEYRIELSAKI